MCQEAERRHLDIDRDSADNGEQSERDIVSRLSHLIHGFFRCHCLVGAGCVGAATALFASQVCWDLLGGLRAIVGCAVVVAFLTGLVYCCWPLRQYRTVLGVTLVAWCCFTLAGIPRFVSLLSSFSQMPPFSVLFQGLLLQFILFWGVPCLLLSTAVLVRTRYWPVYPSGHCVVCGYNLHGLQKPRCPECGTPFDVGWKRHQGKEKGSKRGREFY